MKTYFKFYFTALAILAILAACSSDDDNDFTFVERDRTEQQAADNDSLQDYFATHYYNSSFIENTANPKYTDIVITELQDGETVPDGSTLLSDSPFLETHTTTLVDTEYEYYILRLNQGGGTSPKFTDFVRVRYEGASIEDGEVFDVVASPEELRLQGNGFSTFGAIRGWQLVIPSFNSAIEPDGGFVAGSDGTINYNNFGLGVMFIPSGLAYYSAVTTGTAYDNLVFKFELLQFQEEDHDGDGIPSYVEDLDDSVNVFDDDTEEDGIPNFVDVDDDNDGVATINELLPTAYNVDTTMGEPEPTLAANEYEISRTEADGIITINTVTIVDTDGNGQGDYLDADITTNYNESDDD